MTHDASKTIANRLSHRATINIPAGRKSPAGIYFTAGHIKAVKDRKANLIPHDVSTQHLAIKTREKQREIWKNIRELVINDTCSRMGQDKKIKLLQEYSNI